MTEVVLAFLAGLLIGSFLNVCIFRLPRDLSVVRPRSFCPACEKTIAWYDNVPLLSYVLLRGRCRHCGARFAIRYPLVELLTGLAFAICVAAFGVSLLALKFTLFSAIMIALIFTDLEERILPDEFTLGGILIGLVMAAFVPVPPGLGRLLMPYSMGERALSVSEAAIGAALSGGSIWLVGWIYQRVRHRDGLGLGDVKMIAMIGAFLGLQSALLTLIAASVLGAIGGLIYVFATGKEASTYELPFGSFIGVAALAVARFGESVVAGYSSLGK
jgi:leader peptidase (prepilin peptidase) / N-methyltransferase